MLVRTYLCAEERDALQEARLSVHETGLWGRQYLGSHQYAACDVLHCCLGGEQARKGNAGQKWVDCGIGDRARTTTSAPAQIAQSALTPWPNARGPTPVNSWLFAPQMAY